MNLLQGQQRKKICIIGAAAVGKTSLVSCYSGVKFASACQSTLGVNITKVAVAIRERLKELIIWDIKGESSIYKIPPAYLYGSSGVVLVADGTRHNTCDLALALRLHVKRYAGEIPAVMLINKSDQAQFWEMDEAFLAAIRAQLARVYIGSARNGIGVRDALDALAYDMWSAT